MPAPIAQQPLSLLWPPGFEQPLHPTLSDTALHDTGLMPVIDALSLSKRYQPDITRILRHMCQEAEVIQYRQDIIDNLLRQPELTARLEAILPEIGELDVYSGLAGSRQTRLQEVIWRLGELDNYVTCITQLKDVLTGSPVQAAGLRRFKNTVLEVERDETFQSLLRTLPEMLEKARSISSVTVGINIDPQLRPVAATLLSINNKPFHGAAPSLLGRLFGSPPHERQYEGISPLRKRQPLSNLEASLSTLEAANRFMEPLFKDLESLLKNVTGPISKTLRQYIKVNDRFLVNMQGELAFYIGAVRFIEKIRGLGLPISPPTIRPADERAGHINGLYNMALALRMAEAAQPGDMVHNNAVFDDAGRIFIVTGPNRGGKTTYTQAIGQLHALAQAGLFVPARSASLSPVDSIYTHFPVEEQPESEAGRLGEEARRLSTVFRHATPHSLILLNESLASTSFGESLYLAQDIVRSFRVLGARVVFATHLHDLGADTELINQDTPGDSRVISLVSLVDMENGGDEDGIRRTYRIVPGPPLGRSYAREIAARYGISLEKIMTTLEQRNLISNPLAISEDNEQPGQQ
jgi:DNA mismatch repair ATPase MutS